MTGSARLASRESWKVRAWLRRYLLLDLDLRAVPVDREAFICH